MRTKTINIYEFHELSEDAKQKALDDFRKEPSLCDIELCDGAASLKAYCEHFGVKLLDYRIGAYCANYAKTNASNDHFRGLKLKDCNRDNMPTGYCIDWNFFGEFYDEFERTGNAKLAFERGLDSGLEAIKNDCESCFDDDYLINRIEANEYEYLENGEMA